MWPGKGKPSVDLRGTIDGCVDLVACVWIVPILPLPNLIQIAICPKYKRFYTKGRYDTRIRAVGNRQAVV